MAALAGVQAPMTTNRATGWGMGVLPRIIRGEGSYLYDADGRRYLDGSGGPAAFSIGHGNREVNAAINSQLAQVACGYRYLFTSEPLEQLTQLLLRQCGTQFAHVVYCSSGSEAVESALKVALQFWEARGLRHKKHFIARERSYHGNTLGALSVSGFLERRRPFEGSLLDVSFVSGAGEYRPLRGLSGAELVDALAQELDARITALGAERVAAFVFEPVVGAAGGAVPAPEGYAAAVRAVCDRHGVLMIADEVMCGSGRCGTWRALAHDGVVPDIMAVGKGLAGGYIPLAATIVSREIGDLIVAAHGAILTGHTYSGHTAACAAGLAVQRIIERESLVTRVRERGARLRHELRTALDRFEEVGDVRGRGYLIGIELVRDRATREPFAAERGVSQAIGREAFEGGLICYPCTGNVAGTRGDTIIVAPPYNASDAELAELIDKFAGAVGRALARTDTHHHSR
jgi:adenosylmethionine-8-amino-7-oxononanoate aminotransferase